MAEFVFLLCGETHGESRYKLNLSLPKLSIQIGCILKCAQALVGEATPLLAPSSRAELESETAIEVCPTLIVTTDLFQNNQHGSEAGSLPLGVGGTPPGGLRRGFLKLGAVASSVHSSEELSLAKDALR